MAGLAPAQDARQNRILARLPEAAYRALEPSLEDIVLPAGRPLFESDAPQRYLYFPASGIIELHCVLADGASTELAMVGCEGMVGLAVLLGVDSAHRRADVMIAGRGRRMPATVARRVFEDCPDFRHLTLRYLHAVLTQMAQTAACNRRHTLDQQLCRCILLCLDRVPGNELTLTHQLIADSLGVRRESISQAAHRLQEAGILAYQRGHIRVLDRGRLERSSCECYEVIRREYDRTVT